MTDKQTMSKMIELMMSRIFDRSVEVNFSQLGKDKDYSVAIQKTLYEFDEFDDGPKGPMYLTMNSTLLQDSNRMLKCLTEIANSAEE